VLPLLALSQFVVVLNTSIVNVALPVIGDELDLWPAPRPVRLTRRSSTSALSIASSSSMS